VIPPYIEVVMVPCSHLLSVGILDLNSWDPVCHQLDQASLESCSVDRTGISSGKTIQKLVLDDHPRVEGNL
jgi:hypothetical protein